MKTILIVSDSRGKLLKSLIKPPLEYTIDFEAKNGATLREAKDIVWRKLTDFRYTCVYVMAGICRVTSKDQGLVYLPFDTKAELVNAVTWSIWTTLKELDDSFTTPIVLCTFPGVNLMKANNKNAVGHHPQQTLLNDAMIEINEYIIDLNLSRGFTTPMLYSAIHRCHGKKKDGTKKYRHHYCRLQDRIHPAVSTLDFWKKRLEEDFAQFTFDFETL